MLSKVIVAASASGASGHGWIHNPISKNEMAYHHFVDGMPDSLRWEPQTCYWGNQAGVRIDGNGYSCGAKEGPAAQGLNVWQKWYDAAKVAVPSITPGQDIPVQITITADHGGQAWFTIACADHIGEDVAWTYLERSASDRDHHFMPSNPGIYAWATSEAASTMGNEIKASWTLPEDFTCPSGKVVGRWLWKTGSSCNDFNNVGRPTETFNQTEYQRVLNAFHPHTWMKVACTDPPETFISCLDFQMSGMPPSPPGPSPPTPPPAPPAPTPPPAPSKPKMHDHPLFWFQPLFGVVVLCLFIGCAYVLHHINETHTRVFDFVYGKVQDLLPTTRGWSQSSYIENHQLNRDPEEPNTSSAIC